MMPFAGKHAYSYMKKVLIVHLQEDFDTYV
jgi:hypothetical protein